MKITISTRVGVTHLSTPEIDVRGIVGGVGMAGLDTDRLGNSMVISGNGIKVAVTVTGIACVSVNMPLTCCS